MRKVARQLDDLVLRAAQIEVSGDLQKLVLKARAVVALSAWLRAEEGLRLKHEIEQPVVPRLAAV